MNQAAVINALANANSNPSRRFSNQMKMAASNAIAKGKNMYIVFILMDWYAQTKNGFVFRMP
ncbi:MAG: hypothetical protein RL614_638 [Pseudomonadota bacterium]